MYIDPWVSLIWSVLILTVPIPWLLAAAAAAAFHELCHAGAILLAGERIYGLQIRPWGMVMETSLDTPGKELLAAIAGPVGSLSLLTLCHVWPRLALCGLVQGLFNLFPVYPMDGGRTVRCIFRLIRRKIPCKGRENTVQ